MDTTPLTTLPENQSEPHKPSIRGSAKSRKWSDLEQKLTVTLGSLGMMLATMPATSQDGLVVMQHTQSLVERLIACARDNEGFYKILVMLVTGSVWGALAVECLAITQSLLIVHGVLPMPEHHPVDYATLDEGGFPIANGNVSGVSTHP